MRKLWNDRLILGMIVFTFIYFFGSFVNGDLLESIINFLLYFIPGFVILLMFKPLLKSIGYTGATIGAVLYAVFIIVVINLLTRTHINISAVILLGCFAHRIMRYGTLFKEGRELD